MNATGPGPASVTKKTFANDDMKVKVDMCQSECRDDA